MFFADNINDKLIKQINRGEKKSKSEELKASILLTQVNKGKHLIPLITDRDWKRLESLGNILTFSKNEVIIKPNEPCFCIYRLLSGSLLISYEKNNDFENFTFNPLVGKYFFYFFYFFLFIYYFISFLFIFYFIFIFVNYFIFIFIFLILGDSFNELSVVKSEKAYELVTVTQSETQVSVFQINSIHSSMKRNIGLKYRFMHFLGEFFLFFFFEINKLKKNNKFFFLQHFSFLKKFR